MLYITILFFVCMSLIVVNIILAFLFVITKRDRLYREKLIEFNKHKDLVNKNIEDVRRSFK